MNKFYKLGIISTHKCNQQCYYCNNYDVNNYNKEVEIDLDYLQYSLDLFNKNNVDNLYIEISGGEPGLISNLDDLITMLNNLKYIKKIDILSNGLIRLKHNCIFDEFKTIKCIEHPALNIVSKNINYFYKDITFFNNTYNNVSQVLVLDDITIDSLANNFYYFLNLCLFNNNNIYFKIITPKTNDIDYELINKYDFFYNKLKNIYKKRADIIFNDYYFINRDINDNSKNVCNRVSSMQFIDLDNKKIGQCSMDIQKSEYHDINNTNISKTIKGLLFSESICCEKCIKYDTNSYNILLDRYKYSPEYYNIIESD